MGGWHWATGGRRCSSWRWTGSACFFWTLVRRGVVSSSGRAFQWVEQGGGSPFIGSGLVMLARNVGDEARRKQEEVDECEQANTVRGAMST